VSVGRAHVSGPGACVAMPCLLAVGLKYFAQKNSKACEIVSKTIVLSRPWRRGADCRRRRPDLRTPASSRATAARSSTPSSSSLRRGPSSSAPSVGQAASRLLRLTRCRPEDLHRPPPRPAGRQLATPQAGTGSACGEWVSRDHASRRFVRVAAAVRMASVRPPLLVPLPGERL
jgi:hypothetical protein